MEMTIYSMKFSSMEAGVLLTLEINSRHKKDYY